MDITSKIPKKRGKKSQISTICAAVILLIIGASFSKEGVKLYALFTSITTFFGVCILSQIIYRCCLIVEEIEHVGSRYDSITTILKHAIDFSPQCITVFVILLCIYLKYGYPLQTIYEPLPQIFYLAAVLILFDLLKPKYGPLCQALSIGDMCGLDFGSSMAHSFFNGYLRLVLPWVGTEQKGIKELMKDFESKHGVKFAHDRLIVLFPLSLYCPSSAGEHSKTTEIAQSLEDIQITRAGVKNRSYKSTVYKITTDDNKKAYVCIEYATPLRTLSEAIDHSNEHAYTYKLQKKELVLQFYLTLQSILANDPDCKNCCDLLLFDDKTEDGQFIDVGPMVLDHINNLKPNKNNV